MLYHIGGMTTERIKIMAWKEKSWWLKRLHKQLEEERKAIENPNTGSGN